MLFSLRRGSAAKGAAQRAESRRPSPSPRVSALLFRFVSLFASADFPAFVALPPVPHSSPALLLR